MNITIVIYFSILFLIAEMRLLLYKRTKKKTVKKKADKYSLIFLWVSISVGITLGFMFANYGEWDTKNKIYAFVGLGVWFIGGLLLRNIAIHQLKNEFTVDVGITKNHKLKTTGLYKHLRHPSYTGLIFAIFGLALAMNSLVSLLIVTVPVFIALRYRIHIEEQVLLKEFGDTYRDYIKRTKMLIPGVY